MAKQNDFPFGTPFKHVERPVDLGTPPDMFFEDDVIADKKNENKEIKVENVLDA